MAKKYVRILQEVEAIQAKKSNLEELRAFAGDVKIIDFCACKKCYDVPGVANYLFIGDWLIKHNGQMEVMSNQEFKKEYEPK